MVQEFAVNFRRWFRGSVQSLMETRVGQIPALDGLRTVAITLVILAFSKNDLVHAGAVKSPEWLFDAVGYGWTGVDLFFVLSGFLIGRMLFREVQTTGTVALVPFLIKRGLRIWPLYYFVCALVLSKMVISHQLPPLTEYLPDLLFVTNFFKETLVYGSWSLSVEEQFYLLASVFILFSRKWIRSSAGKILHLLAFLFCCVPFARAAVWNHYVAQGMDLNYLEWEILHSYIFTHCDGLLIGLIFANLAVFKEELLSSESRVRSWVGPILGGLVVAASISTYYDAVLFKYTLVTLIFGVAVWHCIAHPSSRFAQFMSWRWFQVFSRLSYGMYIWYRFPLWRIASYTRTYLPGMAPALQLAVIFVVAFSMATVASAITYILIERPFLQLRDQLLSHKSRTSPIPIGPSALVMERVRRDHLDYT